MTNPIPKIKPQIVTYDSKDSHVLRSKAQEITRFDSELQDIVETIKKTFALENKKQRQIQISTVGLAAPQIGVSKRIFVIYWGDQYHVFINPEIKAFGKINREIEGCLSFPDIFVAVNRPEKVKVKYYNEKGQQKRIRAIDFFSRIIQHENDHLNGVLLSSQKDFIAAESVAKASGKKIDEILQEKYFPEEKSEML
jgi:peptide deformylase